MRRHQAHDRTVFDSPNFDMEAIEFHPVPATPEPGGLALFALGALALA
jgi:hypothetical protein